MCDEPLIFNVRCPNGGKEKLNPRILSSSKLKFYYRFKVRARFMFACFFCFFLNNSLFSRTVKEHEPSFGISWIQVGLHTPWILMVVIKVSPFYVTRL